jgi:hypothetical protein
MKPPTFEEAKEPLATDAWIRAIEAKFSVFTLPCSVERKASVAALQLHGAALIWWENFKTMIPIGHQITWVEFKQAFKEHHIPKCLMDRKIKELLALKQGSDRCMSMLRNSIPCVSMVGIMLTTMPRR